MSVGSIAGLLQSVCVCRFVELDRYQEQRMGGNGRQFLNRIRNGRPERKDPLPIQGMTRIAVWRFIIFPETTQSTWAFAGTDPRLFPSSRLSFNCLSANTSVGS